MCLNFAFIFSFSFCQCVVELTKFRVTMNKRRESSAGEKLDALKKYDELPRIFFLESFALLPWY